MNIESINTVVTHIIPHSELSLYYAVLRQCNEQGLDIYDACKAVEIETGVDRSTIRDVYEWYEG
jgi:hypothetical protein